MPLLAVLGLIIYMVLDLKWRTLVSYMYKSVMRWITGVFVTIDPIGILKIISVTFRTIFRRWVLKIGNLKGQMRKLVTIVEENNKEIQNNMLIAKKAKEQSMKVLCYWPAEKQQDFRKAMKNTLLYILKCPSCIGY
ncbi:MAG: hypothetical protein IPO37_17910 [Saprospiraceae bacterium]|nr:hypothetical protein [Saprospiraceae bacterium]